MSGLTLTGDWKKLRTRLNTGRFDTLLNGNMRRATARNGQQVARAMRKTIKERKFTSNAALTVMFKGYDHPLIDHAGGLFQAISSQMVKSNVALAGVFRTAEAPAGSNLTPYNVTGLMHEGFTIKVTPRMRGLFDALAAYTHGHVTKEQLTGRAAVIAERIDPSEVKISPLRATTEALHVPARPFIRDAVEDQAIRNGCRQQWRDAYDAALRGEAL